MTYEQNEYLVHYGIKGQKKGLRRFQNEDGSYTAEGKERYGIGEGIAERKKTEPAFSEKPSRGIPDFGKAPRMRTPAGDSISKIVKSAPMKRSEKIGPKKEQEIRSNMRKSRAAWAANAAGFLASAASNVILNKARKNTNNPKVHSFVKKMALVNLASMGVNAVAAVGNANRYNSEKKKLYPNKAT